jgi:hypothetical protein
VFNSASLVILLGSPSGAWIRGKVQHNRRNGFDWGFDRFLRSRAQQIQEVFLAPFTSEAQVRSQYVGVRQLVGCQLLDDGFLLRPFRVLAQPDCFSFRATYLHLGAATS